MRKRLFSRKPALLKSLALALSMAIPLAAADLSSQIVRVSETKTLDAAPAGTLHLEHSRGSVSIEGWDQPLVEITVIKSTTGLFHASDAARHLLDQARIKSDRNGDEILVSTQVPRRDQGALNVQYYIKAPRKSKIVINAGTGGAYVTGMAADINATLKQGQVTLILPENADYDIDARARFGEVYWGVDGQGQRHHLLGHSLVGRSVPGGPFATAPAPVQAPPRQTVPITVTPSVDGVGQAPRQINAPVVPDSTRPQPERHKLHLNVCFGDILITRAYIKQVS